MNIFDEVKKDFDKRNALGWEQYKKELMPEDDVDWLQMAYEEGLDWCVYLKGELLKRERAKLAGSASATRHTRVVHK